MKFFFDTAARLSESKRVRQTQSGAHMKAAAEMPAKMLETMQSLVSGESWNHLNDVGKKSARQKAFKGGFEELAKLKRKAHEVRKSMQDAAPKLPALDKTDIVGEMQRAELRALYRSLPADKKDLHQISPAMAQALISADPSASGIPQSTYDVIKESLITQAFPDEVHALNMDMDAIGMMEESIRVAEAEMVKLSGLSKQEVTDIQRPILLEGTS
jgi:hypothetical protein